MDRAAFKVDLDVAGPSFGEGQVRGGLVEMQHAGVQEWFALWRQAVIDMIVQA
jgi:hypothetical protein